jgi:branched-chain amino acid transport system permease protein
MLAMYATFWIHQLLGLDPYVSILVVAPLFFLLGLITEKLLIKPTIGKPHLMQVFMTFGLSFGLQNLALIAFGADFRSVRVDYTTASLRLGEVLIPVMRLVSFAVALLVALGLYLFVKRTYFGKAIRAAAQDRDAAALMGIDVSRVYMVTFAIGTACVGVAGAVMMPIFYVYPTIGFYLGLVAYVVVVLGGLGSIPGAVVGGLVIGVVETVSGFFLAPALKQIVYFAVFVLILIVRPAGLLGQRGAEVLGYE